MTAVEALVHQTLYRSDLKDELKQIYDLERLAGKISFGSANARDLVALKKSLGYLPSLKTLLEQAEPTLLQETGRNIDPMPEVRDLLNAAIDDDPPVSLRDGGIIKAGYNAEVDRPAEPGGKLKPCWPGWKNEKRPALV